MDTPKRVVIVLEYLEGGDLYTYLVSRGPTAIEAALPNDVARNAFLQILYGVQYAHLNKIIHRDLKLENILYVCCALLRLQFLLYSIVHCLRSIS
jgi:5'-AMP-activated protein kinase, catalytic alpha subunit